MTFSQFFKTFCVFILIINILFCRKNQKNVLQKEIKDWTLEAYLLIEEKLTCARSYLWFLNCFGLFFLTYLAQTQENNWPVESSIRE